MRLGLFNKPLKRDSEPERVLDTDTNEDEVVFAGSIRGGGNLEEYLNEIGHDSASVADTDVDDINDMRIHIEDAILNVLDNRDIAETEQTEESVVTDTDDTYESENDNQDFEENIDSTDTENDNTNEENLSEIIEETEHSDDFATDSTEVDNVLDENSNLEFKEDSGNNDTDLVDDSDIENKEVIEDDKISDNNNGEADEHTENDYMLDLDNIDDTDDKIETVQSDDSVHNNEHKDLVCNEVSMKEKFISLDIAEKKEYIQKLFAEFDELSEYLIEYRDKIDQKVDDMQQMIKSLYIQISTCDLEDARGIVEKIQKYTRHNKALEELKNYIDNIMSN